MWTATGEHGVYMMAQNLINFFYASPGLKNCSGTKFCEISISLHDQDMCVGYMSIIVLLVYIQAVLHGGINGNNFTFPIVDQH